MTAFERVRNTKRSFGLIVGSSAVFWAFAALFALLSLSAVISVAGSLPPFVHVLLPIIAVLGAIAVLVWLLWRGRFAWSFDKVALWIEERIPSLRYALVTAIDPRYQDTAAPLMEPIVSRIDTGPHVRDAAKRSTLPALLALIVTAAIFLFIPRTWKERLGTGSGFSLGSSKAAVMGNRLIPLTGTLTPPGYANLPTQALNEPTTVSGLQGSHVMLTGNGTPDGIEVTMETPGSDAKIKIPVQAGGRGWMINLAMTDSNPALLRFVDRNYTRSPVIIDPIIDQPPTAKLISPTHDTTLRMVNGKLNGSLDLQAELHDDIGISKASFQCSLISGGGGDPGSEPSYDIRECELDPQTFGGQRAGSLTYHIAYSDIRVKSGDTTFKLQEGDMFTVRAIVYDNNGYAPKPGIGYSETRTIRIATKAEYDSLNVNPAPPSADTALLTLRMLIMATQHLDSVKTKMERQAFVDSAYKLAGASDRVRQTIERIIDEQTGGGEIDPDPLLVLARDSMWSASTALKIADTHGALPPMIAAYNAIMKYTKAKRYYLRGVLKVDPVNVDRVRLTGKDTGDASARLPRPLSNLDRQRMMQEYVMAVQNMKTAPSSTVDLLTTIEVEALRKYPAIASALGDAVAAIRSGKDPSQPLLRARQQLDGRVGVVDTIPAWSGAW